VKVEGSRNELNRKNRDKKKEEGKEPNTGGPSPQT
jgi:hypothetical protein